MKRNGKRKLELNRQTIRALTTQEMADVAGGAPATAKNCLPNTALCKTWDCLSPPLTARTCQPPSTIIWV